MRIPKWQKKLSKHEREHLKVTTDSRVTLKGFKENREWQKEHNVHCLECERIARVLGLED